MMFHRRHSKESSPLTAERISQRVLYIIVALTALMFAAFFLIGYNAPYEGDTSMKAPMLTGVLITFMMVLLIISIVIAAISAWHGIKVSSHSSRIVNGIHSQRIAIAITAITIITLASTLIFSSADTMMINGSLYTDEFSLRIADMFVGTSIIMLLMAIAAAVFGATRYYRKNK